MMEIKQQILECKIENIFLSTSFNICFGCPKEPSHGDGSFANPQQRFWLRNKKNIFIYALLPKGLELLKHYNTSAISFTRNSFLKNKTFCRYMEGLHRGSYISAHVY